MRIRHFQIKGLFNKFKRFQSGIFLFLLFTQPLVAQVWTNYTTTNGIGENNHCYIAKSTSKGYVYIGNFSGTLSKFDMANTWSYLDNGIIQNINHIAENKNGDVWISGTNSEVYQYNGTSWIRHTLKQSVNCLYADKDGVIWCGVANSGLAKYDGKTWTYIVPNLKDITKGILSYNIFDIFQDSQGNMWFLCQNDPGITKFDGANWTTYTSLYNGISAVYVSHICQDKNGRMVFTTSGYGLFVLEGNTWSVIDKTNSNLPGNSLSVVMKDKEGNLWVASSSNYLWGVGKYNGTTWTTYSTGDPNKIPGYEAFSIDQDKYGDYWFTSSAGVTKLSVSSRIICTLEPLDFGNVDLSSNSAIKEFTVSWTQNSNPLIITPPYGFEVSTSNIAGFQTTPLYINPTSTTNTKIYVRFKPKAARKYSDKIKLTCTGLETVYYSVSGTGRGNSSGVAWNTPAEIPFGRLLYDQQLNATATVAGTFTYNPPIDFRLDAGDQILTTTFIPTDSLNNTETLSVTIHVTKAPLEVYTKDTVIVPYGQSPNISFKFYGFKEPDGLNVLDTMPTIACEATNSSKPGEIYPFQVLPGFDNNYEFTRWDSGIVLITKAPLTVYANDKTIAPGNMFSVLTISYSGFVNGESESVLDVKPNVSTTATDPKKIGTYPITVSGGSDNDYEFTYVNGTYTITNATSSSSIQSDNILIYPNPFTDKISIQLQELTTFDYCIISSIGKNVAQGRINSSNAEIDLHKLNTGMYIIKINTEKESFEYKLIKE